MRVVKSVDDENSQKIELYLNKFDHPEMNNHGKVASAIPYLVIHHAGTINARKETLNIFMKDIPKVI